MSEESETTYKYHTGDLVMWGRLPGVQVVDKIDISQSDWDDSIHVRYLLKSGYLVPEYELSRPRMTH